MSSIVNCSLRQIELIVERDLLAEKAAQLNEEQAEITAARPLGGLPNVFTAHEERINSHNDKVNNWYCKSVEWQKAWKQAKLQAAQPPITFSIGQEVTAVFFSNIPRG